MILIKGLLVLFILWLIFRDRPPPPGRGRFAYHSGLYSGV